MSVIRTLTREIRADTRELLHDTSAIKEDTAQILAEIARLQEQLPRDLNQRNAGFMLERYLDNLTSYAETVCDQLFSNGLDEPQGSEHGSIRQQSSAPTSRPRSRAASSRSSRDLGAEIPDLPVFANQNSNKPAWATENELTPQSISPKPLKPPSPAPLIATATSSLAIPSRENRDQQLETEAGRAQHLEPRYASQLQ
jgi:hypothetical protein